MKKTAPKTVKKKSKKKEKVGISGRNNGIRKRVREGKSEEWSDS